MKNDEIDKIFEREIDVLNEAEKTVQISEFKATPLFPFYKKLADNYKKLFRQSVKLVTIGDTQQEYLHKLQGDLKNILDNMGQGILTTDENLVINDNYSAKCIQLFDQEIGNKKFSDILKPYNSADNIQVIDQILNKDFFKENDFKKKVLLQLLPNEVVYKCKLLDVKYMIVQENTKKKKSKDTFMIVLTDITEKKQLAARVEEEQQLLKMVVRIVSDKNGFKRCVLEYENFYKLFMHSLAENSVISKMSLYEALRKVHTFKGDFSLFEMRDLAKELNVIELSLLELIENYESYSPVQMKETISGYCFCENIELSLNKVKNAVGYDLLEKDEIVIERVKLQRIEEKCKVIKNETSEMMLKEVKALQYSEFKSLLQMYPEYVLGLAERNGKLVSPFEIQCSKEIAVDQTTYYNFTRTLVNVFRNAVSHGIEEPGFRVQHCKKEFGEIHCSVDLVDNRILIEISDDGKGIDIAGLTQAAMEKGIYQTQTKNQSKCGKNNEDLIRLIFVDGISTATKTDELSGLGEGLAAVYKEVEMLGGRIEIETSEGKGTIFKFFLPLKLEY
jgi:two-component system, chemotaxis family, sensor kinase CheA